MYRISVDTHTYPNEDRRSFAWCATASGRVVGVGDAPNDKLALERASEAIRLDRDLIALREVA
tara:strand:+ start:4693 stop:4881 length:189 start_codon:yes stop_codon:yes gene_type:complete